MTGAVRLAIGCYRIAVQVRAHIRHRLAELECARLGRVDVLARDEDSVCGNEGAMLQLRQWRLQQRSTATHIQRTTRSLVPGIAERAIVVGLASALGSGQYHFGDELCSGTVLAEFSFGVLRFDSLWRRCSLVKSQLCMRSKLADSIGLQMFKNCLEATKSAAAVAAAFELTAERGVVMFDA